MLQENKMFQLNVQDLKPCITTHSLNLTLPQGSQMFYSEMLNGRLVH